MPSLIGQTCPLTLLNQGSETSLVLKKKLAAYLGVPTGRQLGVLRRAAENIRECGSGVFEWRTDSDDNEPFSDSEEVAFGWYTSDSEDNSSE